MPLEKYIVDGTDEIPHVVLDAENGLFEIKGISRPEDVSKFYDPIVNWLWHYSKEPNSVTQFNFRFDYFNTASAKILYDLILILNDIKNEGYQVEINWYYEAMDIDMKGAGEEFNEMADISIGLVEVED